MGIVAGLAIYLGTVALVFAIRMLTLGESTLPPLHPQHFLILSLLSAIVTHFVEINFGIAVAATRTTFWACAGLLVVAGLRVSQRVSEAARQRGSEAANQRVGGTSRRRKKRRQKQVAPAVPPPETERTPAGWLWPTLGNAIVGGFILGTLAFDFVVSLMKLSDTGRILWQALTILPMQGERTSYGILMIVLLTWLVTGLIFLSEMARRGTLKARASDWLPASLLYLTVSLGLGLAFALLLAGHLAALLPPSAPPMRGGEAGSGLQVVEVALLFANHLASRMILYYGFVAFVLLAGGLSLMRKRTLPRASATTWGPVALIPLLVLSGTLAVQYNLAPIQANMIYRQADPYDREGAWDVALAHYERASELAPHADVYYFELGRAYSHKASSTGDLAGDTFYDRAQQERLLQLAEQSLIQAREINPLKLDHSVSLTLLYRQWYDLASDPVQKEQLAQQAIANYEIATTLSLHDAVLWNTQGNFCAELGQLEKAAEAYEHVVELAPRSTEVWRILSSTYAQLGRLEEGIAAMQEALELEPEAENAWNSHLILAVLYSQLGRPGEALSHAQTAWQLAPEEEKPALQDMITQLQQEQ
jgi:tetratricopeptide (TPR) repeat protein